jgi:hypothetical protein
MEVAMRLHIGAALLGSALIGALSLSSPAAADWQNPYFYRNVSGSWTNVEYNDGVCHYYYSHNAYDNQTTLNKYGDCSQIAIGPDGVAIRVYAVPAPY